jgi:phage terminase large subunit-like protein
MPWQRHVADVVMEIDPTTGRLAYQEMGLTVPRQSGKSTWVLAKSTHRASATKFFGARQHLVYTAQTRMKAREKWEEDFLVELQASAAFRNRVAPHMQTGGEYIRFVNGSRFGLEAATEKAGHGGTLDEAYIDEAFAQADYRLEQAFEPAMITRANTLLAWISTAGWLDGSPYLSDKVDLGRAAIAEGRRRGLAYFEWSAPEDADPGDEAVWWMCMPALGRTITIEKVRDVYEKAVRSGRLNDFRRAYLNQWVPKDVDGDWLVISQDTWGAAGG